MQWTDEDRGSKSQGKELDDNDSQDWGRLTYHASLQPPVEYIPFIIPVLPLFFGKADSPAMVKHGLDNLRNLTKFLNDGQTPVLPYLCNMQENSA